LNYSVRQRSREAFYRHHNYSNTARMSDDDDFMQESDEEK